MARMSKAEKALDKMVEGIVQKALYDRVVPIMSLNGIHNAALKVAKEGGDDDAVKAAAEGAIAKVEVKQ